MANNSSSNPYHHDATMAFWSRGAGMTPLAPTPVLPYPPHQQLNAPLTTVEQQQTNPSEDPSQDQLHFPVRLHYMLQEIHKEGLYTNIVSWQPHGRCFVVHDKKQFVEKILCLWFRQSKWASFQRQLNMYGFKRLSHGLDKGGYYHDLFLRDHPKLAQRINRQKVKGTGPRRPAQPDQEPNFYALPSVTTDARLQFPGAANYEYKLPETTATVATQAPTRKPTTTITLRNSLALPMISGPEIQPRMSGGTSPLLSGTDRKLQADSAAIPLILPSIGRVTTSLNEEEELDSLDQLASWF